MPEFVVLDNIDSSILYRGYSWEQLKSLVRPSFCFFHETVEGEGEWVVEDDPIWDF